MKITKEQLEFDSIHKARVNPFGNGGYIPFFKKFVGRIVHVIIPKEERVHWVFPVRELEALKNRIEKMKISEPYQQQHREAAMNAIVRILDSPNDFDIKELYTLVGTFDGMNIPIISKIEKVYNLRWK